MSGDAHAGDKPKEDKKPHDSPAPGGKKGSFLGTAWGILIIVAVLAFTDLPKMIGDQIGFMISSLFAGIGSAMNALTNAFSNMFRMVRSNGGFFLGALGLYFVYKLIKNMSGGDKGGGAH